MQYVLKKIVSVLFLGVLLLSFFLFVFLLYFARSYPQKTIEFLQLLIPTPSPAPFHLKGIAIMGDSQSDEYRADDNRGSNYEATTLNWVELLAQYRQLNFGEWNVWPEPRRTGYAYNFARTGATTNSMIESGQHIGALDLIKKGQVNLVVIFIGANDFAPYITFDGYEAIYDGTLNDAELFRKENRVTSDIMTAVDTIYSSGKAKIVLIKILDWGKHLGVQIAFPDPTKRSRVTQAISYVNDALEKQAHDKTAAIIDPNLFYETLREKSPDSKIHVGSVALEKFILNNDPHNEYLEDGVHMGTVMNGLFANFIIASLDSQVGTSIKPFTDAEILSAAGLK